MKIAVSAEGQQLDSLIDARFGRAPYFLIIDSETLDFKVVPNPYTNAMGGAGIQSAQLIIKEGADVLITGRCGPNALRVLETAHIDLLEGAEGSIETVINSYNTGQLKPLQTKGPGRAGARHQMGRRKEAKHQKWSGQTAVSDGKKAEKIRNLKDHIEKLTDEIRKLNQELAKLESDQQHSLGKNLH